LDNRNMMLETHYLVKGPEQGSTSHINDQDLQKGAEGQVRRPEDQQISTDRALPIKPFDRFLNT
jgi:hypothetical protein